MEFREIEYLETFIKVYENGVIIWNNTVRKPYLNPDGYPLVSLKTNLGWRGIPIHRLVALAFIPNPLNLNEVNHIDYDRSNFSINNLEWITHIDNVRHSLCNKPDMKGKNNPNYGNRKLSKFYSENSDMAKIKQSRPNLQNGRCRKIELYENGNYVKTFDMEKDCINYLSQYTNSLSESIRGRIDSCSRNNSLYLGRFSFKKL